MRELIQQTRTFRKFEQDRKIDETTLRELINLGRLGGSARNCQPWQYMLITESSLCEAVFPYLGWAGYLPEWSGPVAGEQPAAYILCLLNRDRLKGSDKEAHFDLGIATQNMLLGAMASGIGGCRIGAFSPKLSSLFDMPAHLEIGLVLALGYPAETVTIVTASEEDDIKYWRDADDVHHVPKRRLDDIILTLKRR